MHSSQDFAMYVTGMLEGNTTTAAVVSTTSDTSTTTAPVTVSYAGTGTIIAERAFPSVPLAPNTQIAFVHALLNPSRDCLVVRLANGMPYSWPIRGIISASGRF